MFRTWIYRDNKSFNVKMNQKALKNLCFSKSQVTDRITDEDDTNRKYNMEHKMGNLEAHMASNRVRRALYRAKKTHKNLKKGEKSKPSEDNPNYHLESFTLQKLNPGDMLCSRSLLSASTPFTKGSSTESKNSKKLNSQRARFDIVAMSAEVVTYEFKKHHIAYIPKVLQKIFLKGIESSVDFDLMDISKLEDKLMNWDHVKQEIYLNQINKLRDMDDWKNYKKY